MYWVLITFLSYFRFVIVARVFRKGGATGFRDFFCGCVVDVFEGEEMEVGEGTVDANVKAEVWRLDVVIVQFSVTMTVEHDGTTRLLVPRDHRVVAHHHTEIFLEERSDGGTEAHLLDLIDFLEIGLVGTNGTVVIAFDEELVTGELFEQMAGILAFQKCQVAKNIDSVALVDRASPEVQQPLVVRLDIDRVGIRAVG